MALTKSEKTNKEALDKIGVLRTQEKYVNIFNLTMYSTGQVQTELRVYENKEARIENPNSQIKTIGTNVLLPEKLSKELKNFAFSKLYPYVEAMYSLRVVIDEQNFGELSLEEQKQKQQQVYTTLGLEIPESLT